MAVLELGRDPSFSRAEKDGIARLVDASLELGRAEARRWRDTDLLAALARRGVLLRRLSGEGPGARAGYTLCALTTFEQGPKKERRVDLYVDVIERKWQTLCERGVEMDADDLLTLHLAHEFYHVLEFSERRMTPDVVGRLPVHGLLGTRMRRIPRTSEIAAHAFARAWTGLEPSPGLIDAIVLAPDAPSRARLEERILQAHALLTPKAEPVSVPARLAG